MYCALADITESNPPTIIIIIIETFTCRVNMNKYIMSGCVELSTNWQLGGMISRCAYYRYNICNVVKRTQGRVYGINTM